MTDKCAVCGRFIKTDSYVCSGKIPCVIKGFTGTPTECEQKLMENIDDELRREALSGAPEGGYAY